MGLGTDDSMCKKEFVEAMRTAIEMNFKGQGSNVDSPPARDNLGALGTAVFNITTKDAETWSDQAADAAFWQWVGAVQAWIGAVQKAFTAWTPATAADQALKSAVLSATLPGKPAGTAPISITGAIR